MSMGVREAIAARYSARAFSKEAVTGPEIDELLEAARNAPSSLNSQPWRFMAISLPEDVRWFGTSEASRNQAWLADASAIIVCCADLEGYVRDSQSAARFLGSSGALQGESMAGVEAYVAREAAADDGGRFGACAMNVAIAVSFMMLRAVEMGLGTCWVGMFDEANVKARFAIPPRYRIVNLLAVGRPAPAAVPPRRRKPAAEIVMAPPRAGGAVE
jgi:nitroreductase